MAFLAIAGLMLSAASAAGQASSNKKQLKFRRREKARNDLASKTSYANAAQRAEMAAAGYKGEERYAREATEIEAMKAEGAQKVHAAVSGVTGVSVANALTDIRRSKGRELVSIRDEYDVALETLDMQMRDNYEALQAALASGQMVDMSSDFANIINITTAGITGFMQGGGFEATAPGTIRSSSGYSTPSGLDIRSTEYQSQ